MSRHESFDPYKKQREAIRKQQEAELDHTDSMLELRQANEWVDAEAEPPAELFGTYWRTGELAVLVGESGTGKTILTVQIANDITGRNTTGRKCAPPLSTTRDLALTAAEPQGVLYIDFQRTAAQWTERYSYRTQTLAKFLMPYEFPKNFQRAGVNWEDVDLTKFKRDPLAYAFHSIYAEIQRSNANVIIIDDIDLGGVAGLARNARARIMQTLKLWTTTENLSILVISNSPPGLGGVATLRGRGGRSSLRIPKHLSVADSIFSLNPSTFGPQYRYIKPLRSQMHHSPFTTHHSTEVAAYELISSSIYHSPLTVHHSKELPIFLMDLGPSNEEDHLRDYAAEAKRADRESRRYLKSAKSALVDGLMDGSYMKYLKG